MQNEDHFMKASAAWEQGDLKAAFNEFHLGAKEGDTSCQLNLGIFYDDGLYVEHDKKKPFIGIGKYTSLERLLELIISPLFGGNEDNTKRPFGGFTGPFL